MFLEGLDQGAIHPFQFVTLKVPQTVPVLTGLGYAGHLYVLAGVLLLGVIVLVMLRSPRAAALLTLTALASAALTMLGKHLVERDWPNPGWALRTPPPELRSFPSGAALMSTVVYASLGILLARRVRGNAFRGALLGLGFSMPFLVGTARLCMGHNYLTDVLAGWAAGAVLVFVCADADRRSPALDHPS